MRYLAYLIVAVLIAWSGEWTYRTFFRQPDPLTPQMLALAQHFNSVGIRGHIRAIPHGFQHSFVVAAAAYQIDGYPLAISLDQSPNEAKAEELLRAVRGSPNLTHPQRNGVIVMYLPMWGKDTTAMAAKVSQAFASFGSGT